MPRIRCHYDDCVFLEDGYCGAAAVEIDPDSGCMTYRRVEDDKEDDWDEDDFEDEFEDEETLYEDEDEDDDDPWDEDDEDEDEEAGFSRRRRR